MGVLIFVVLMIFGLIAIFSPETSWYLNYGWRYRDAEPSDAALAVNRFMGAIALVGGIIYMIFSFSSCIGRNSDLNNFREQFSEGNIARVSVTYNFLNNKELDEKQISELLSIVKGGSIEIPPDDEGSGMRGGAYHLDANVYFKDGLSAKFSTLDNNFDIDYNGRTYYLNSDTLARFLVDIMEKK